MLSQNTEESAATRIHAAEWRVRRSMTGNMTPSRASTFGCEGSFMTSVLLRSRLRVMG
jgi:hypothetical protein